MKTYNLVLSGGGVRSYAHLGIYKYCFENGIIFNEITAVSGGALIAPFVYLRKHPDQVIALFKKEKIHKLLFPFISRQKSFWPFRQKNRRLLCRLGWRFYECFFLEKVASYAP